MTEKNTKSKRIGVSFILFLLIFLILSISILFSVLLIFILVKLGIMEENNLLTLLLAVAAASIAAGSLLSRFATNAPINSIIKISDMTKEVARGNFNVHLDVESPIREIQEMAENFNVMVKELAGTEMLRNDFVENVSHEFKTPLSSIEGYATLLQKPGLSEERRREYTRKILYNTRRLSSLTGNILLLSRLENQETGIKKTVFCLDEQIRETILAQEETWIKKSLELDLEMDPTDFYGSPDLLSHVWENIFGNAVKFTPDGGRIRVKLEKCREQVIDEEYGTEAFQDYIRVYFTDNGCGMSEEIRKRAFEKFYQGDHSRSSHGNGLGLALAKRIVDLHGGEILVFSQEGEGTTFTVSLPVLKKA